MKKAIVDATETTKTTDLHKFAGNQHYQLIYGEEELKRRNQAAQQKKPRKGHKKQVDNAPMVSNKRQTLQDLIDTVEGQKAKVVTETYHLMKEQMNGVKPEVIGSNGIEPHHFTMLSLLGKGATARVILVRCVLNNCVYAMKVIDKYILESSKGIENALHERRVLSRLKSPFIMNLYCSFQTSENLYLIMDFCQGGELFKHILDKGFFDEDVARFYIAEVILAIESLHKEGIIHRDIKPENILLSSSGHIVLGDFGVCFDRQQNIPSPRTDLEDDNEDDGMCDTRVCGTYNYMAPEVLNESISYGKAIDWWSVGCLLYEMSSGNPPFVNNNRKKMLDMIIRSKLKLPSFLSKETHSLLKGLLERDVTKRLGAERNTFTQVGGVAKLKQHPYFKKLDWLALERGEIIPPIQLEFSSNVDTQHFLVQYTEVSVVKLNTMYTTVAGDRVHDFSYVSEDFRNDECFSSVLNGTGEVKDISEGNGSSSD